MNEFKVKLAGLALLVAMVISMIPTLTVVAATGVAARTIPTATVQESVARGPEHAVEVLVSRVELLIGRINEFSQRYNISLDENMTSLLIEAENLLNEAKELKEINVSEALRTVLRATRLVTPVYVYVIQNLPPTVKDDFAVRRTEAQFQVRERSLISLNRTVSWLVERGVNVPEWVRNNITRGFNLINEGRLALQKGNITRVKEILKEVDEIVKTVMQSLKVGLRVKWVNVVCSEKVLTSLVAQVNALIHIVNDSAESLEAGDLESAVRHLNAASEKAERVLNLIGSLKPYVGDGDKYAEILELSEDIVVTLKEAVENATVALDGDEPDIGTALTVLSNALEEVQPSFDQLKALAKWRFGELEEVKGLIVRVRERVREKVGKLIKLHVEVANKLNGKVNQLTNSFASLVRLRASNRISCSTYLTLLNAMRQFIEELRGELPQSGAYEPHRVRLNDLYNQIAKELNSVKC
ncbi:MAG: hypothetical protein QW116_03790 [Zestosphaera sp.]